MFKNPKIETRDTYRLAIFGLLTLSFAALGITLWIMFDFLREQDIVKGLIEQLPPDSIKPALTLADELKWQFRLAILVVLNLVVTGFAVQLLWNAYSSSQRSLEQIKALAGDILTSVDQAVITTDLEGLITSANQRTNQLLNLDIQPEGKTLSILSQSFPISEFWSRSNFREGKNYSEQLGSNTSKILQGTCHSLTNQFGDIVGSVIQLRDITQQSLTEERLRRIERYMGLGSLAAGLHHEIKNPLTALSLHIQLLNEHLHHDTSPETRETLGIIRSEITRVGGVLENFRDYASADQLETSAVSVVDLLRGQIDLLRPQFEAQRVRPCFDPDQYHAPFLQLDRIRMEQVLLNLFLNSMEAMPQGGDLTVEIQNTSKSILIRISDTGEGIPKEIQDRIFDPYFTTKKKGTGMGLAVCDKIVRQHNGALEYVTGPQGTTFSIVLPLALSDASLDRPTS